MLAVVDDRTASPDVAVALSSLRAQTRTPDSIVVVRCDAAQDDDVPPGVGVFAVPAAASLAQMVAAVTGEHTCDAFLLADASGWSAPDRLERLLAAAEATGAAAVCSETVVFSGASAQRQAPVTAEDRLRTALLSPAAAAAATAFTPLVVPAALTFVATAPADPPAAGRETAGLLSSRAADDADTLADAGEATSGAPTSVAPTFVVGAPGSGADVVLWALAQHHQLRAVDDVSWLLRLSDAVHTTSGNGEGASVFDVDLDEALAALAAVAQRRILEPVDAPGRDARVIDALRWSARTAIGDPQGWVAVLPPTTAAVLSAASVFPQARFVHVVRGVDAALTEAPGVPDAAAVNDWVEATRALLAAERLLGASRVARLPLADLRSAPAHTLAGCLASLSLPYDAACLRPLAGLPFGAAARVPAVDDDTRGLSDALEGPRELGEDAQHAVREALLGTLRAAATVAGAATASAPMRRGAAPAAAAAPPAAATRTPTTAASRSRTHPMHAAVRPAVELVDAVVTDGSPVIVASRGDDYLLGFRSAKGWHFPRNTDGVWAGYHPADTAALIRDLEAERAKGAKYFLIPRIRDWWLKYYADLRRHLEGCYAVAAESAAGGVLFDISQQRATAGDGERAADRAVSAAQTDERVADTDSTTQMDQAASPPRSAASARAIPGGPRRTKVAVLSWDMTHNPLGRAFLLADMLRKTHDVQLVGAKFPSFGNDVWAPLRDCDLPMRTFPGGPFPQHFDRMTQIALEIDADVIYVSKPRLPSFGLGILVKALRNRALVLDIDDHELTFVGADASLTLDALRERVDDEDLRNPYGRLWTRYCDGIVHNADAITVSNVTLQTEFGGTIIPHARDERVFDPDRYDRDECRRALGFARDDIVLLFAGTPRRHKGLIDVAASLARIGDPRLKLCLIATREYRDIKGDMEAYAEHLHVIDYQPFSQLPQLLRAADLMCVLQDPNSAVAQFQMPAKITDALAMHLPCLVSPVAPLRDLIAQGQLEVVDGPLTDTLQRVLGDLDGARERALRNRELFLDHFSYGASRPVLTDILGGAAANPRQSREFARLIDFQHELFDPSRRMATGPAADTTVGASGTDESAAVIPLRRTPASIAAPPAAAAVRRNRPLRGVEPPYDIVLFWKQNDTGIYGRRHDMLMRYLVASDKVNRLVEFDAPVHLESLRGAVRSLGVDQGRLVADMTLHRAAGIHDGRLHQHTFVYGDTATQWLGQPLRGKNSFKTFVAETLQQHGIGDRPTLLWMYPKNFDFAAIAEVVPHDLLVADVVDDHRTWAEPGSIQYERIWRNYQEIVGAADLVFANCEQMRNTMRAFAPQVHLVANGCEYPDLYADKELPTELELLPRPIVGYVGNLSSRLDVPLLAKIATSRPDWSLVLIGSMHAGQEARTLEQYDNVYLLGPRPYEDAKRYIKAFDVGIIPHLDNEMTRAMNPLKAFVYCALGVPVVSTDIANLGELRPLIQVGEDADDFIAKVAHAAAGRVPLRPDQEDILVRSSWTSRVATIESLIADALAAHAREPR